MIVVALPDTYRQERLYILEFIFGQVFGVEYESAFIENKGERNVKIILPNERCLILDDILFQTPESNWLSSDSVPASPLPTVTIDDEVLCAELSNPVLPILFAGEALVGGSQAWFENSEGNINICFDLLGAIFFMLSRYEEIAGPVYDKHQRFDSSYSLSVKEGFSMRPLVDEYVALLRGLIVNLDQSISFRHNRYSFELTYDLDRPYRFRGFSIFVKNFFGHLIKRRDWRLAKEWLLQGMLRVKGRQFDSFFIGMQTLQSIAERYGVFSQINVMGASAGPHDDGYDPGEQPLCQLLQSAASRGHHIGFHPGYSTYIDTDQFSTEKRCVEESLCVEISRVRQHYLRMSVPLTWRIWHKNGISSDGSVGFSDRVGFRAGTCHSYFLFDLESHCKLNVRESPLIVMDGALKADFNEALEPTQALEKAIYLANICKKYGGTFSLLWHNSSLHGEWSGWQQVFEQIVKHAVEIIDE